MLIQALSIAMSVPARTTCDDKCENNDALSVSLSSNESTVFGSSTQDTTAQSLPMSPCCTMVFSEQLCQPFRGFLTQKLALKGVHTFAIREHNPITSYMAPGEELVLVLCMDTDPHRLAVVVSTCRDYEMIASIYSLLSGWRHFISRRITPCDAALLLHTYAFRTTNASTYNMYGEALRMWSRHVNTSNYILASKHNVHGVAHT